MPLLLGLVRHVEPQLRRRHPLVRRAVVPGIVERAIPDLEEDFEELLDALPIHRRPTLGLEHRARDGLSILESRIRHSKHAGPWR